ncbi:hypothetical protein FACS1894125_1170 [Actinomycetota bacterium]|nr:hypothetical protein FACS1894125_1170 [Actinomycetota bacterium]
MQVKINGKAVEAAEGTNVAKVLTDNGFDPKLVVVELNKSIVPKHEFEGITVPNGGELEVLSFVGGG